jgi:hypothetical protein
VVHRVVLGLVVVLVVGAASGGCSTPAIRLATPSVSSEASFARTPTIARSAEAATATATGTPTTTPSATAAPAPTNTPTPIPAYTLSGTVFFDYNGNGLRDGGEPAIEGVPISVAGLSTTSGPDGSYSITGVPAGTQQIYVESPTQEPATAFRYISLSLQAFQPVEEPIRLVVEADASQDIALMQGYLTLPYKAGIPICVISYLDLAGNSFDGTVRDWLGSTSLRTDTRSCSPGEVYDWHCGIDYAYGTDYAEFVAFGVYAAAPGTVDSIGPVDPQYKGGSVRVKHVDGRSADYAHLGEISVTRGQRVSRGDLLGRIWVEWDEPHLHFELMGLPGEGRLQWDFWRVDIYRDPTDPASVSYWTFDNNSQYSSQYTP